MTGCRVEKSSQCQTQAGQLRAKISPELATRHSDLIQRGAFDKGKQARQYLLGIQ
ncbi:hypothetical protein D3C84_1275080 [compost metagenome]